MQDDVAKMRQVRVAGRCLPGAVRCHAPVLAFGCDGCLPGALRALATWLGMGMGMEGAGSYTSLTPTPLWGVLMSHIAPRAQALLPLEAPCATTPSQPHRYPPPSRATSSGYGPGDGQPAAAADQAPEPAGEAAGPGPDPAGHPCRAPHHKMLLGGACPAWAVSEGWHRNPTRQAWQPPGSCPRTAPAVALLSLGAVPPPPRPSGTPASPLRPRLCTLCNLPFPAGQRGPVAAACRAGRGAQPGRAGQGGAEAAQGAAGGRRWPGPGGGPGGPRGQAGQCPGSPGRGMPRATQVNDGTSLRRNGGVAVAAGLARHWGLRCLSVCGTEEDPSASQPCSACGAQPGPLPDLNTLRCPCRCAWRLQTA